METPVIIGIAMIAAGLGIAGFIVYTLVAQNRRERAKLED
jgi:hypothetical protein